MSKAQTRENVVEQHLVKLCATHGLLCLKMTSPGRRAVPDRMVLGYDNNSDHVALFVELKRPGQKPRADQARMFAEMRDHGAHVVVADTIEAVERLIDDYYLDPPVAIAQRDPHTAPLPGKNPAVLVLGS